jgi:sec-independent protein translocase protein TatC
MTQEDIDKSEAPLLDHLVELRSRLIKCVIGFAIAFIASFYFSTEIFSFLTKPFEYGTGQDIKLITTELLGFFIVKMKIAMFGGMFIAFPLIATQIYMFMAPGLYRHERQALAPYLVATPIFFVLGAAIVYYFLLPAVIRFSSGLVQPMSSVELTPRVESYLDFVTMLILAFGLAFQLPVVLTLLGHLGVVKHAQLVSGRRFAIVAVCAVAAVITPPDPISMLAMAIPLAGLYEIAVIAVGILEKRRDAARLKEEAETETAEKLEAPNS